MSKKNNIINIAFELFEKIKKTTNHNEFVVVGSLSSLGIDKEIPEEMLQSNDIDFFIKNDPKRTDNINNEYGINSVFNKENGYFAEVVSPNLPSLPKNWLKRLKKNK